MCREGADIPTPSSSMPGPRGTTLSAPLHHTPELVNVREDGKVVDVVVALAAAMRFLQSRSTTPRQ